MRFPIGSIVKVMPGFSPYAVTNEDALMTITRHLNDGYGSYEAKTICVEILNHKEKRHIGKQCWVDPMYFTIETKKAEDILKSWV